MRKSKPPPRSRSSFSDALIAPGPAKEYAEQLMLYGQFVGDWRTETRAFLVNGEIEESEWDIRFDWVLEGRAIQDVWITPPRRLRQPGWSEPGNRYSTTLRLYDPRLDAWHIIWANPPSGLVIRQLGRKVGAEIVQHSDPADDGSLTRWVYRDIARESFRWCNELSRDQGASWTLMQEMHAHRVHTPRPASKVGSGNPIP